MEIKVEGGDTFANASYETICRDTFRDLGIGSSIDDAYLYLNPEEHVFIISITIGRVASPIKVGDVASIEKNTLRIGDEKYAPKLLSLLWEKFGERVEQLSRLVIELDVEEHELTALKELVIYDPREDLIARILDAIDRILPEGARVRNLIPIDHAITIIASEDAISDEWMQRARELIGPKES
ncbi:MAG TPA: methanogenesis marker 17 protein [Methanomicrobia archaeon]|nr:methanogenesis marker 17 protein [Methanomicrobia archaeon]